MKEDSFAQLTAGADVRIMTANILSEEWGGTACLPRAEILYANLMYYKPDVIGAQEVSIQWTQTLHGDNSGYTSVEIPEGVTTYELNGVTYTVIRSATEMNTAATANAKGGVHYILAADLVYSNETPFTQVSLKNGSLNGNGHSIIGVNITTSNNGDNEASLSYYLEDCIVALQINYITRIGEKE